MNNSLIMSKKSCSSRQISLYDAYAFFSVDVLFASRSRFAYRHIYTGRYINLIRIAKIFLRDLFWYNHYFDLTFDPMLDLFYKILEKIAF